MEIKVFGKQNCGKCESTKNKVNHLLEKWGLKDKVVFSFIDLDTLDGLTEGTYHDVKEIPTTVIAREQQELARFEGDIPHSSQLGEVIGGTN